MWICHCHVYRSFEHFKFQEFRAENLSYHFTKWEINKRSVDLDDLLDESGKVIETNSKFHHTNFETINALHGPKTRYIKGTAHMCITSVTESQFQYVLVYDQLFSSYRPLNLW